MGDDKLTPERIRELLGDVKLPGVPRDIVSLGIAARIDAAPDRVRIGLRLPGGRNEVPDALRRDIEAALAPLGVPVEVEIVGAPREAAPTPTAGAGSAASGEQVTLPGVRTVLAVSSAKGGVGKSTVASNLACAFAARGLATGLLDADVYGPSLPLMMGIDARPRAAGGNRFFPVERHGVRCISMGFFLDESSPVIWRGPMVAGLLRQFLNDCVWGDLDVLVVDLPPGTGDAQLTLVQQIRLSGALIVTTPQDVALRDVVRGVAMFRQVQVPILGVVENMSFFTCPECGQRDEIFGHGGGEQVAEAAGAPLLARLPIDTAVREQGDDGVPIALAAPESAPGAAFRALAARVAELLGLTALAGATARA
jgi:ATP-binding protein involved in chromosome partitioning